jgi:hypothetical protein
MGVADMAQVEALCKKLMDEFKPELADLKKDVEYLQDDVYDLQDRVKALEEQAKRPKAFGWIDYRMGLVAQPTAASPDAYHLTRLDGRGMYDNLTAKIGIDGAVTDEVNARIALKVRDGSAVDSQWAENIWLDEAYIKFPAKLIGTWNFTAGRQYQRYGDMGLLVDSAFASQQGVRSQWNNIGGSGFSFDAFTGSGGISAVVDQTTPLGISGAPRYSFGPTASSVHDTYTSMTLKYAKPNWSLGFEYLPNGQAAEKGTAIDGYLNFWGNRNLYAQYARQSRDIENLSHDRNKAFMGMVDVWKASNFQIRGFYSDAGPGYSVTDSALNPYFEHIGDPYTGMGFDWERFTRNPPVMNNLKVRGGMLDFKAFNTPFTVAYYDLKPHNQDAARLGLDMGLLPTFNDGSLAWNKLYTISLRREIANGVELNLTYGVQHHSTYTHNDGTLATPIWNTDRPDNAKLLEGRITLGF